MNSQGARTTRNLFGFGPLPVGKIAVGYVGSVCRSHSDLQIHSWDLALNHTSPPALGRCCRRLQRPRFCPVPGRGSFPIL